MKQPRPTRSARSGVILKILAVLAALVVAGVVTLGIVVYRMFSVDADLRSVRKAVFADAAVATSGRVEVSVPSALPALARVVIPFTDAPREARQALRAVRGGDVGVYQLQDGLSGSARKGFVERVSRSLEDRDWVRTVAVLEGDDTVLVFTPATGDSLRDFEAFVVVLHGRELVLVHGKADLEPVMELIETKWREEGRPALALAQ